MYRISILSIIIAIISVGCTGPDHYYYKGEVLETMPVINGLGEHGITRDYNQLTYCEQEISINGVGAMIAGNNDGSIIAVMPDSIWYADPSKPTINAMDAVISQLNKLGYKITEKKATIYIGKLMSVLLYTQPGAYDEILQSSSVNE